MAGGFRGLFGRVRETLFPSRRAPVQTTTQAGQVRERKYGGSTRAMAAAYGVSARTVQRWVDGSRHPTGPHQGRLRTEAVEVQTTERGRARRARQLAQLGPHSGITARVGRTHTFNIQGSDAVRARDIHLDLTGDQAAALALAQDEGEVREIIGRALADYFNGGSYGGFSPDDFEYDTDDFDLS
ncbi:helix-turn-helix domain-containing protein [Kitasatospora sp. NPDC001540]|uniref:helix-turn-helix domain-containing protein n=1 Tax=Kitasatospora sp. NPDC001540 TaxID=3364014 RepID=UPI00368D42EE